jgi:hypothetical protein
LLLIAVNEVSQRLSYLVIIFLLPTANLLHNIITKFVFHVHVQIGNSLGFRENAFPCRLSCTIFGTCGVVKKQFAFSAKFFFLFFWKWAREMCEATIQILEIKTVAFAHVLIKTKNVET